MPPQKVENSLLIERSHKSEEEIEEEQDFEMGLAEMGNDERKLEEGR